MVSSSTGGVPDSGLRNGKFQLSLLVPFLVAGFRGSVAIRAAQLQRSRFQFATFSGYLLWFCPRLPTFFAEQYGTALADLFFGFLLPPEPVDAGDSSLEEFPSYLTYYHHCELASFFGIFWLLSAEIVS